MKSFFSNHDVQKPMTFYYLIPVCLAILVSFFCIDGTFVFDDLIAIKRNRFVTGSIPFWQSFLYDFWGNSTSVRITTWRPLIPMIWKLIWAIYPDNPLFFRILTLILHVIATISIPIIFRSYLCPKVLLTAASIFAIHPLHSEVIGGIVSHADIMATILGLYSLYFVLEKRLPYRMTCSLVLILLACLTKESAIIYVPINVILVLMLRDFDHKIHYILLSLIGSFVFVWYQLSFERAGMCGAANWMHNIALAFNGLDRIVYGLHSLGRSLSLLFVPIELSPLYGYGTIVPGSRDLILWAILGLFFLTFGITGLVVSIKGRNILWTTLICLLYGPCLFQSHLFFHIVTAFAERLLYPATIAASVLISLLLTQFVTNRAIYAFAISIIIMSFGTQSWNAERAWRNELSLYSFAIKQQPFNWRAHYYYANTCFRNGVEIEGIRHYLLANYIFRQYPKPVDIGPFESFVKITQYDRAAFYGPLILNANNPCSTAIEILGTIKEHHRAFQVLKSKYTEIYGDCIQRGCDSIIRTIEDGKFVIIKDAESGGP